jgi:hypothetical protein
MRSHLFCTPLSMNCSLTRFLFRHCCSSFLLSNGTAWGIRSFTSFRGYLRTLPIVNTRQQDGDGRFTVLHNDLKQISKSEILRKLKQRFGSKPSATSASESANLNSSLGNDLLATRIDKVT